VKDMQDRKGKKLHKKEKLLRNWLRALSGKEMLQEKRVPTFSCSYIPGNNHFKGF
jgi:hypothetical protein